MIYIPIFEAVVSGGFGLSGDQIQQ